MHKFKKSEYNCETYAKNAISFCKYSIVEEVDDLTGIVETFQAPRNVRLSLGSHPHDLNNCLENMSLFLNNGTKCVVLMKHVLVYRGSISATCITDTLVSQTSVVIFFG